MQKVNDIPEQWRVVFVLVWTTGERNPKESGALLLDWLLDVDAPIPEEKLELLPRQVFWCSYLESIDEVVDCLQFDELIRPQIFQTLGKDLVP